MTAAEGGVAWLPAGRDYSVALDNGKLVCRNPQGKRLASVPKWLKDDEVADRLVALCSGWTSITWNACTQSSVGCCVRC